MSIFDGQLKISVAAASGIEAITKRELKSLGYGDVPSYFGRMNFIGSMEDVARCNVFLRTASKVRIILAEFKAETFDELFDGIYSVNFGEILPLDANVAVEAKSVKSKLFALSTIQSVVKKAIVKKMTAKNGLVSLPESGERYSFELSLVEDTATLSLDTSGDGLHKRGYRQKVWIAPMRETMAAAIILNSFYRADRVLIDPFCGSGTIPIEAALIATNTAPGINRNFAFEKFHNAPDVLSRVRQEAEDKAVRDISLRIYGYDIDARAIKLSYEHAERAGVKNLVHFEKRDMRDVTSRYAHGIIITNPPYGERLSGGEELKNLYRDFGKMFRSLDEWSAYVVGTSPAFEKYFGQKADKKRKLYNSEIECILFQFFGAPPKKREDKSEKII